MGLIGVAATVALYFHRRRGERQEHEQALAATAVLQIEDPVQVREGHTFHPAQLTIRNPRPEPIQVVEIEQPQPPDAMVRLVEDGPKGPVPALSFVYEGGVALVDLEVPAASPSRHGLAHIRLFVGSTARRISHTTVCVRLTYQAASDRRRRTMTAISNEVALMPAYNRVTKISSSQDMGSPKPEE